MLRGGSVLSMTILILFRKKKVRGDAARECKRVSNVTEIRSLLSVAAKMRFYSLG